MALRKTARTIDINQIKSGQVLEIVYDGEEELILVVDPNSKATTSHQSRPGKLHAIKLVNYSEDILLKLLDELRSTGDRLGAVTKYDAKKLYEKFFTSSYAGDRTWRSYTREKISQVKRITVTEDQRKDTNVKDKRK